MNNSSVFDHPGLPDPIGATDLWGAFLTIAHQGVATVTRRNRAGEDLSINAAELEEIAGTLASQLCAAGAQPGDCVLLVNADPMAFVCGFWACQAADLTAVSMPPMGTAVQIERTRAAIKVLGRAWVLTEDASFRDALVDAEGVVGAFVMTGDHFARLDVTAESDVPAEAMNRAPNPDATAVIMFSSGSTGDPKGVELSHRAILAQTAMLQDALSVTARDCFVNWMPMSHDFGLFHFHILPLLSGLPQVLMAPEDFARQPVSWIRALHDHRGTITGAPNLALQMVTNLLKPQRAAQFDLSRVRCVTLGAEPLDPVVLRAFADRLAPAGLESAALWPAYGLAEATLVVTMRSGLDTVHVARRSLEPGQRVEHLTQGDPEAVELPLLGRPVTGVRVQIVDDAGAPLPPGTVGHLQIRCGSLMQGYRNRPDQSAQVLRQDGWLDTGDIGFLREGQFVMAGRAKDVIISGGRNYHPADLERIAQGAPGLTSLHQIAIAQGRDPADGAVRTLGFLRVRGQGTQAVALQEALAAHVVAQTGVVLDHVLCVRDLPRTTSGKLQRHALSRAYEHGAYSDQLSGDADAAQARGAPLRRAISDGHVAVVTSLICNEAALLCGTSVDPAAGLMDQGLSSRQAVTLCARLGTWLGRELSIAQLFDHPSPRALAQALIQDGAVTTEVPTRATTAQPSSDARIAVIGYGCRFPGSDSPEAFWDFLTAPHPVVAPIPADRWTLNPGDPDLPPAALLSQIDSFDAGLFGVLQGEAEAMNPIQRLLLQVLWQALEHAGLDAARLRGKRVGLFVGLSETGLGTGRGEIVADGDALAAYAVTGSAGSIAVGRMAHLFDFRGPALAVDTACSSSIVALDLAAQALRQGRCDLAVAGGANLILSPDLHVGLHRMGALSPDGLCKTFDASADGYGRGEGAGLVVLKRLDEAARDQDTLRAELLATTLNHDGQSASVTAPNGRAQRDLLRRALQEAGLAGDDLDWVETHGTGTALGDPIELEALRDVLRRTAGRPLPLGAVKSLIGHLEAAAGIASVIKILLAFEHGLVPPDRACAMLNDRFDWAAGGMQPITQPLDWSRSGRRLAGVASFGMSGTNAYAILSSPPVTPPAGALETPDRPLVLPLSVLGKAAAEPLLDAWSAKLEGAKSAERADLVAGQASRRVSGPWRRAAIVARTGSLTGIMQAPWVNALTTPRVVFAYPGQGAQSVAMGADLYRNEPVFRAAFDQASEAAGLVQGHPLSEWLYGAAAADEARMTQTDLSQPALVAFGHALTTLWAEFGLRPDAVLGHSVGEIGAALASGQFGIETAMRLAVRRGRLMHDRAGAGAMLALRADEGTARGLMTNLPDVVIAGYNGPTALSLSGPVSHIAQLRERAEAAGHVTAPVRVSRAFHSPAMAQAAQDLFDGLTLDSQPGHLPVFSTLSGMLASSDAFGAPEYWRDQMLAPVRFVQAAQAATAAGDTICLEIGPGAVLSRLGAAAAPEAIWIGGAGAPEAFAVAAGTVWSHGAAVDWARYYGTRGASGDRLPRHPMADQPLPRRPVGALGLTMNRTGQTAIPAITATSLDPVAPQDLLQTEILPIIARISGVAAELIAPDAALTALGMDSLGMVQLQRALSSRLALEVELRALFETVETPRKLADLLASTRPTPIPDNAAVGRQAAIVTDAASGGMAAVMQAQLKMVEDVIARQLQVMSDGGAMPAPEAARSKPAMGARPVGTEIKGLFRQPKKDTSGLTAAQQAHVADLSTTWNARSAGSKAGAQSARRHVANSRAVFGFAPDLKELTYPLMADRAHGAHVWDVDGNRYVDVTMGFGVYLFGHNPDFVTKALHEELDRGAAIGPATPLAEQVAERIHAMTGAERSAFFSTGTEAIMCAVRIARAVTGRQKIVIFKGAYHGSFDGVLATGWIDADGTPQAAPMTDGTLQGMVDPVITLDYGDMAGLEVIRRHADDIALVLVEPVQSRNPENRPIEYLRALRDLTRRQDVPLLFDEVISGFRFSAGGMQDIFGIEADLVTYGKVLGHGQPIGVLSGAARYMDAVDGGTWRYGDDSGPGTRTAFVAGTFNGHPMALAAARAVLDHIRADGGAMFDQLAARTEGMCQRLDALFQAEEVPVRMERFGSLFRFNFGAGTEILNTHLLNNGVFVWEQRNCFLSTAHGDDEVSLIVDAARQGIAAMKAAGWFGTPMSSAPTQLVGGAGELALRRRAAMVRRGTWTDLILLRLGDKRYPSDAVAAAWAQVCQRHPALHACLAPDGTRRVAAAAAAPFEMFRLDGAGGVDAALDAWGTQALEHTFAFDRAPLRLSLIDVAEQTLALTSSHLGFDGWSLALILNELGQILDGRVPDPVDAFDIYRLWEEKTDFFRLDAVPLALNLPVDGPEPDAPAPRGQRETRVDIAPLYAEMAQVARANGITPLAGFMAPYVALLGWLSGQTRVSVGIPVAGQALSGCLNLVGNLSFVRPVSVDLTSEMTMTELGRHLHSELLRPGSQPPLDGLPDRHALFNLDGPINLGAGLSGATLHPSPVCGARADLFLNLLRIGDRVVLDFDWNSDRFTTQSAQGWLEAYLALTRRCTAGDLTLAGAFAQLQEALPQQRPASLVTHEALETVSTPQAPERAMTATEAALARIWQDLLGRPVTSPDADFLDLGGSSLQAVRLLGRITAQFDTDPSLEWIFATSRLADMATGLENHNGDRADEVSLPAVSRPRDGRVPALPQQQQLHLLAAVSDPGPAYNICLRLDLGQRLEAHTLALAMQQLARRHASLRTTFAWSEDQLDQVIAPEPSAGLSPQRLSPEADIEAVLDRFAQRPFEDEGAPLWRIGLLDQPKGGSTLVLVLHHIISDAWSAEIMVRDLLDACQRVVLEAQPLPALAQDFPDHAQWVADSESARNTALAFWRERAAQVPALTALPGDASRPVQKSFAGARASRKLPPDLLRQMQKHARTLRTTPFQIVMAAIATHAVAVLDCRDVVIGTVSAGRNRPGMDRVIGLFANTLPLCLDLPRGQSWSERIALIRAALLEAAAHDLVSLQEIVATLGLRPDPSANPLFEICVTHDDRRGLAQLGAELGFDFAEMALPTSQFDLSFYVIETGIDVTLDVTYATAIHSASRVEALLDVVFATLARICRNPDAPADSADFAGAREATLGQTAPEAEPTALQKRLWFVDSFENGVLYDAAPTYYNMAAHYTLDPAVTADCLNRRLTQLYQKVPALRVAFDMRADQPCCTAMTAEVPPCATLAPDSVEAFIDAPFDLAAGGLLRVARVSEPTGAVGLLVVAHHIVADLRGLDRLAAAMLQDSVPADLMLACDAPMAPPDTSETDLAFWRATLGANPPRLLLPVDQARAAVHVFARGTTTVRLGAAQCAAIEVCAARNDVQSDDLILTAFVALLHRLSGQDSIVLGQTCPRTGRGLGSHDNLVTLNIVVDPDHSTTDIIAAIARQSRLAEAHGQTDFDTVVLDLKPDNDMSRTALFDVLMVRDSEPAPSRCSPGAIGWGKYDLVLAPLRRQDGGLDLGLTFNSGMFDAATIRHWGDMLAHLLTALQQRGDQPFDLLSLMPDVDVAPLIAAGAPRRSGADIAFASVPEALTAAAARYPDAIALRDEMGCTTYGTLVADARALAHGLVAGGVQPGDRVAVLLPRGPHYVRAMLAVMQAGAAFVPLDMQAARERTARILEDAAVRCVLISSDAGVELLPPGIVRLDITEVAADIGQTIELPDLRADDAAYVIFTSGSTGRPKGVVVEHRNLLSLVLGQGGIYPVAPGDRWSWFHSPAFDFSVWEVWGALLTAGEVVVIPDAARTDMVAFRSVLVQHEVTQLSLTPSAFRALSDLEMSDAGGALSVATVWFGGEALTPAVLQPWSRRYPACRLINLFGITETTVHTTFRPLTDTDLTRNDSPIGVPLPSYGLTIRDRALRPVPAGVQGEIVVSGSGVARGYLGQPEQTANRFVDDPHDPGRRLYRSGDLGRMSLTGEVTYLGRADDQVKLRGYRIELGEVESGLSSYAGVRAAAAGLLGDHGSEAILSVWLTLDNPVDPDALNAHLAAVLPAYMIPRRIFVVDSLPLTSNGKIDRKALRGATNRPLAADDDAAPPRAGLEMQIAAILCALLERPVMARTDSFFALGGHSLMANKAVLRLRAQLGMSLTLRDFFAAQSVAALAALGGADPAAPALTIPRVPEAESYPLSSAQTRLFAMQTAQLNSAAYNMVGGFIIEGPVQRDALALAFGDLVNRHEILRTRFVTRSGRPVQIVDPAGAAFDLFEIANGTGDTGMHATRALDPEFAHVFDLARGPLLRAGLGQMSANQWLLVVNLHHIISDGWSVPIMMADLSGFYAVRIGEREAVLPDPLAIQYRDFACWQADQPTGDALQEACEHWRQRLGHGATVTSLPTEAPRPVQRSGRGQMARHQLDAATSAALRAHLAQQGATLFSVCAAALHILLRLRSEGEGPTVIGTADAGRDMIETEDQLGFYLNLLPHILDVGAAAPLSGWLRSATVETGAMLGHKTAPFEQILDALNLRAEPGHNPVFDTLLLVQNNAATGQSLGPLGLRALPDQTRTARYDLNLMVEDRTEIELVLEYDTALFNSDSMDWFLDDLGRLLDGFMHTPDRSPLDVLGAECPEQTDTAQGLLDADDPLMGAL
ncbi:hybrid non-ribosomal peptide synthetase/type I polyketide synthase [Puniceibacterium sp. IMCC21224]|uniref:hybrid non-ribosomal peptide synthetase/type I polyketide synthase n=1 Tax=Puniceibacterium sp. IMCC21224 TaxID=1618204 RepID=UPI00064DD30F|nr:hybrid non-ribosomal peptide synthetase/type I polyketide synthase [Puniceibacterium sp. IMCC21224]KMK66289.1 amino acid adenylation enzyme/thioester reductase family protein [Puniceibacterium sp. IMCC21224]